MTRNAQLQFCKVCVNHKKDLSLGVICGLRGDVADFEDNCDDFQKDSSMKTRASGSAWSNGIDAQVASQGQRFTNYIIDFICLFIFIIVFSFVLGIVLALISPSSVEVIANGGRLIEYFIGAIAGIIYYSTLEGISGRSIGKLVTKTKVVTENGERPDFATIVARSICRYIPFNHFSFLGSKGIGWHDTISKTRVVSIDFNPEKQ